MKGFDGDGLKMEERKQMEEALRKSEEKFRNIFENANDCMAYLDRSGRILDVNRKAVEVFGGSKEELLGKHFTEIGVLSPRDIPVATSAFAKILAGKKTTVNTCIKNKKSQERHVEVSASLMKIDGKLAGMLVIARDVTERKKAEEALRESEENFRALAENAFDGILIAAGKGAYVYANKRAAEITGYSVPELLKTTIKDLAHPDEFNKVMERYQKRLEGKPVPRRYETFIIRKDGKSIPIELAATKSVWKGQPADLVFFRDITERKKVEGELIRLSSAVKMSTDSIVISDLDAKIIDVNEATLKMYGTDDERDLIGKNSFELIAPEDREKAFAGMEEVLEKGYVKSREYHIITKDGGRIPVEMSVAIMIDADGKPIGFVGISRDITKRKRAEEALRRSEEQARHLLEFQNKVIDTADVWIDLLDVEGNVTLWNRAAELISGYSREGVIGHKKIWEWLYPDSEYRAKVFAEAKKIIEKGERVENDETTIRCKDGILKTIRWYDNSILDERGKPVGSIAVGLDITEIKKAQEKIRESEEKLRGIFSTMTDGVTLVGLDGRILDCNDAVLHLHGVSKDEYVGTSVYDFIAPEDRQRAIQEAPEVLEKGYLRSEVKALSKKGETFDAEINVSLLRDALGKPTAFLGVTRDITERKKAEEKLRFLKEFNERVINSLGDALLVIDPNDYTIISANEAASKQLKLRKEDMIGKTCYQITHHGSTPCKPPHHICPIQEMLRTGKIVTVEHTHFDKDNNEICVEVCAHPVRNQEGKIVHFVHLARDVTERKRMEKKLQEYMEKLEEKVEERTRELKEAQEQLLKSERLAAIGELAAMVGHDLRNPLQAITNASYVINEIGKRTDLSEKKFSFIPPHLRKEMFEERTQLIKMMGIIDESVEYANNIVSDLRDFARTKEPELTEVDLECLIQETLSDISIPENVRVSIGHDQALSKLFVDPTQIRRVFTNLITNAIQAMPNGGELAISTSLKDGFALIAFQDTGVGIPKEGTEKLFTPLFTTKPKGVGLGLAICKNIVEAHGGSIEVKSQEGKGSTFTVKLPVKKGGETSSEEGKHPDRG